MGVSTIRSYKSAQIFEAVGLADEFVKKYFRGTPSRIGGVGIEAIAREVLARHSAAYTRTSEQRGALDSGGAIHFRSFSEGHRLSPQAIGAAAAGGPGERLRPVPAVRRSRSTTRARASARCAACSPSQSGTRCRLDEVEPVESIVKRFVTSAMSFGSISKEAHETLAIAMNRLGRGEQLRRRRGGRRRGTCRCPTATRCAAPSSRWPRRGSG